MMNIVVTGCANGIGKYLYDNLQELDYKVYGIDIEKCDGPNTFRVDLSSYEDLEHKMCNAMLDHVDAIVNMAGICIRKSFEHFNDECLDQIIGYNVKSVFNMCKYFLHKLIVSKGSIVNVSSVHSRSTIPSYAVYAMTKGAVESFTRGLAVELSKYGVTVNCLRLGAVDTSMLCYDQKEVDRIPLMKVVGKKDISTFVQELFYNKSITGSVFDLDCGMLSKLSVEM